MFDVVYSPQILVSISKRGEKKTQYRKFHAQQTLVIECAEPGSLYSLEEVFISVDWRAPSVALTAPYVATYPRKTVYNQLVYCNREWSLLHWAVG